MGCQNEFVAKVRLGSVRQMATNLEKRSLKAKLYAAVVYSPSGFTYLSDNFLWFDLTHLCSGLGLLLSILSAVRNAKKPFCGPSKPMLKFRQ